MIAFPNGIDQPEQHDTPWQHLEAFFHTDGNYIRIIAIPLLC